jgi:hypothetical protein
VAGLTNLMVGIATLDAEIAVLNAEIARLAEIRHQAFLARRPTGGSGASTEWYRQRDLEEIRNLRIGLRREFSRSAVRRFAEEVL